jgi:hypothetical protein
MINVKQARTIAENELKELDYSKTDSLVILNVDEIEYAWIFHYASKKYIETGDTGFLLGGNSPLFVSKMNGKVFCYRSGLSLEQMIKAFDEEHGNWTLSLADDLSTETRLSLKSVLNLTYDQVLKLKNGDVVEKGSNERLSRIQNQLNNKGIRTDLHKTHGL